VDTSISADRIAAAAGAIDPVFLDSPQFVCEPLSSRIRVTTLLKVETVNPIRSFKGRGTSYLLHRLNADLDARPLVCASAGNFGQGMAFACRWPRRRLTVFAAEKASPLKVRRIRELGAEVVLEGEDFDQAKDAARRYADANGELFIEDGRIGAIAEGAGTIALELTHGAEPPLDAIFVPLGNGSLVNGVGTWLRHHSPKTQVIAVCAHEAPSMALSFEARRPIEAPSTSIADGIAVRVPVPAAVDAMRGLVDEVVLVTDAEMLEAMRALHADAGLVVEPSGAAGVAATARNAERFQGLRVATILTGGNLTEQQTRDWLY
jgi:threonine dehydratase